MSISGAARRFSINIPDKLVKMRIQDIGRFYARDVNIVSDVIIISRRHLTSSIKTEYKGAFLWENPKTDF